MDYQCRYKTKTWDGTYENLEIYQDRLEVDVSGRGSRFHIIVGRYQNGNYLCIPSCQVGCELAGYQDTFWNLEQLSRQISMVDAVTLVTAIKEISPYLKSAVE